MAGRAWIRVPLKLAVFLVVLLLVLFPDPRLMLRHIERTTHLDQIIDPNAPELADMVREIEANMPPNPTTRQVRKRVERFVYETIPYDWDWNTWGSVDYVPTVAELMEMGREDCDGRAVLAASLLRRMGQDACLASDLRHVWVVVGKDELMGPGGPKTTVSTPTGTKINWGTLGNIPRSLAFGLAVFPLNRELIVLAAMVLLVAHRRMSPCRLIVGVVLMLDGLMFLRLGVGAAPGRHGYTEQVWASWLGLIHATVGLCILWWASGRARKSAVNDVASAPAQ